jgi:hypothetical protein
MSQGQKYWQIIQMGRENVPGTPVEPTTILRGVGTVEDALEVVFPDENVGIATRSDRAYIPKLGAEIKIDDTPATFEQILHMLEAGIKTIGSGVADGSGRVYDYPFPTTNVLSVADIKSYTLKGGDNAQCEQAEYAVVQEFEIKGKADEAWTMASTWFARQLTPSNYVNNLGLVAVEEILFNESKLFIDTPSDGFGKTQVSNQLIEASVKVKTGFKPRSTATGAKYFSHAEWTASEMEISAELTFLHDAQAISEKSYWRLNTARLIQILCEGSELGAPGTYQRKTLRINLPGKWEKFAGLEEDKGASIAKGTFAIRYNATVASAGGILIVNEIGSVP